jgi:hypothetical protein
MSNFATQYTSKRNHTWNGPQIKYLRLISGEAIFKVVSSSLNSAINPNV